MTSSIWMVVVSTAIAAVIACLAWRPWARKRAALEWVDRVSGQICYSLYREEFCAPIKGCPTARHIAFEVASRIGRRAGIELAKMTMKSDRSYSIGPADFTVTRRDGE